MDPFANAPISASSGDIPDIIKVSVESRMISRVDYDGKEKIPTEITNDFKAIFDLANLETGWVKFSEAAPHFALVKVGEPFPPQPSLDHSVGFRVQIKLSTSCGNGPNDIREFSSNSKYLKESIKELYMEYSADPNKQQGKLPIVVLKEWKKEQTVSKNYPSKTFFKPVWQITGWTDRPADLQDKPRGTSPQVDQIKQQAVTPPSTGSTLAPPPAAKQSLELVDSDSDFG